MRSAIVATCLLAAAVAAAAAGFDRPREEIRRQNAGFERAFAAGDARELAGFYDRDATFVVPLFGELRGREEIREYYEDVFGWGFRALELETDEWVEFGELAYETGRYRIGRRHPGDGREGRYLTIWRSQGDRWLIFRDFSNF